MLGSNFALLVKSPGDDGQQLLTTGISLVETRPHALADLGGHAWHAPPICLAS